MRGFFIGFGAALIIGLILVAVTREGLGVGGQADPRNAQLVARGKVIYTQYCASCHGGILGRRRR